MADILATIDAAEQRAADPDAAMCDWVRRQMAHMGMRVPGGDRG